MSSKQEKLQAIRHATEQARKEVNKLETIQSVSYLNKVDQYRLDMARETVKRGEAILKSEETP
jgi:hypothetical protein